MTASASICMLFLSQLITTITTAVGITFEIFGSNNTFGCNDADADDTCILHCDRNTPSSSQFDCGLARECYFYCEDPQCLSAGSLNATSSQNLYAYSSAELCYKEAHVYTAQQHNYFDIDQFDQREFMELIIDGSHSKSIFINCTTTGTESCRQITVNAKNVSSVEIVGGSETIMQDATVYCPQNSDYNGPNVAPCVIDFSGGVIDKGNFYTLNGIPQDIMIYGEIKNRVTIWCNAGSSQNNRNSFENTDCWISASPTTNPSAAPSPNPTANPSLSPTKNPTITPTLSPTKNPTVAPILSSTKNINPSFYPSAVLTTKPSTNPTFNPSTAKDSAHPTVKPTVPPMKTPSTTSILSSTKLPSSNPIAHTTNNPSFMPTFYPTTNPAEKPISEREVIETQFKSTGTFFASDTDKEITTREHFWDIMDTKTIIILILSAVICVLCSILCVVIRQMRRRKKPALDAEKSNPMMKDDELWKRKAANFDLPRLDAVAFTISNSFKKLGQQLSNQPGEKSVNPLFRGMEMTILPEAKWQKEGNDVEGTPVEEITTHNLSIDIDQYDDEDAGDIDNDDAASCN